MDAERFPITTPYGQVPGYELNNGWHRGEDRAMPMDTPILVNGHEIGLSGNSGYVTGPHLHIGRFVGGGDTAPNGGGFHFSQAVVTEISQDATNGKFVRVQADGASWVYLHLSRQLVAVGQDLTPVVPLPPPVPAPPPYWIEDIPTKTIELVGNHMLWDMTRRTKEDMDAHPIREYPAGYRETTAAICHHDNGQSYYMVGNNETSGFNTVDCRDYIAPSPPPAVTLPAAPIPFTKAEECTIQPSAIVYFGNAQDALFDQNALGQLNKGTYKVIARDRNMINLTTKYPDDQGKWINPSMNVLPEPVVEVVPPAPPVQDVQPTPASEPSTDQPYWKVCTPVKLDSVGRWVPVKYRSTNPMTVQIRSLDSRTPATLPLPPHHELMIVSTFRGPDGETYARDDLLTASHRYYALRFDMLEKVVLPPVVRNLDVNHDGDVNISDFIDYAGKYFKPGIDVVARTAKVMTGPKARKFVDGFSKAIKKDKVQ